MLSENIISDLQDTALRVREHIIGMSGSGGCFIGASLSCTDILVYLYYEYLNISRENPDDPERNYLFLSKGHNINIPGIEFYSGPPGYFLSTVIEFALNCKLRKQKNKIVVITGDGELNEGSNCEACLVASANQLDNLVVVVDRNHLQANIETERIIPLEPLFDKFETFGFAAGDVDGHSFSELDKMFSQLPFEKNKPSVIIADTHSNKNLPKADRWFCNFTNGEIESLLRELHGTGTTELITETLIPAIPAYHL